jgi:DNA-directed RNA polymerase specialized sigma24 family protein
LNVRQWLGRARSIDREMKALEKARQDALDAATRITQNYESDGAQSSKDPHAKMERIAEYVGLLDAKHDELIQAKTEITEAIYQLEDGRQRAALIEYYVNCLSWEEVAAKLHYTWRAVMYMKRASISILEEKIKL